MVALVAAVTTALTVIVPALTVAAADAGARSIVSSGSGADTGLDLALPASDDPGGQDERVRAAIVEVMPAAARVTVERVEIAGLLDLGDGRGYLAGVSADDLEALPMAEGRRPSDANEAALPATAAEALGIAVGDDLDLGAARVEVTGLWSSSGAAADRWFGVRAAFAEGGGEGPLAVAPGVVDAVAEADGLDRSVHWTLHPDAAALDLATLQGVAAGWRALPDALAASGEDTSALETAGALVPTTQIATTRAAVLEAAEPVALLAAVLASVGVTALFAALLVGAGGAERRIRWARGQSSARIVGREAARALIPGVVGAVAGAGAGVAVLAVPPPLALVPAIGGALVLGAAAPAALVALLAADDVRALTRVEGGTPAARRWGAVIAASVFFLLAAATTARLLSLGSTLGQGRSGTAPDPLAVLAPAALLLALVLVGAAVPLWATRRLRERWGARGDAGRFLSAVGATRRPLALGATVVLVGAAAGQLLFAAMYQTTWDSASRTAVALQEGATHRIAGDGDDLTPAVLDRVVAVSAGAGAAPVWSANTSIAARSASLVTAARAALAALADPAVPDLDRLVAALRAEAPGPEVARGATTLRVEVGATDAEAAAASVVLLDDWGRITAVAPGADGAFTIPLVTTGAEGRWRVAAVELAVQTPAAFGALVSIDAMTADGDPLDLGTAVMPVDITGDAIDMQPDAGPPVVAVNNDITRVRFVPVAGAAPAVVSRAFAEAAGVGEGDTLPLALVPGADARGARISAIVPAVPGAALPSAVLVDATAVTADRLRAFSSLPGAASAWLPATADPAAVAAVLPDGARLAGTARDDGRAVLSTVSALLWSGAVGTGVLAVAGLAAVALGARRARRSEAVSLRAIGWDAAARRRLRVREAAGGAAAGVIVGVASAAVTGVLLLPAVVTGALSRAVGVVVTVDPIGAAAAIVPFALVAVAGAIAFAIADDVPRRGSER